MDLEIQNLINGDGDEKRIASKLPFRIQLAYGFGHVLNDICSSIWFSYLLVYLHYVLEFDNWQAGFLVLVGQVADAVANPFVGYQSDQPDSFSICRYGKRKIWHLMGSICLVGAFPFVFAPCIHCQESHKWAQLFYFSIFTIIFQFGWAAVQISHLSLIPELTSHENQRTKLVASRYCFTVLSNLFVYFVTWGALGVKSENKDSHIGPEDAPKFQIVVWAGLIVGMICTVLFHVFIKEKTEYDTNGERVRPMSNSVSEILTNIEHYKAAVIYMSTMLFVNLSQIFIPLYLHETLNMATSALAVIPLLVYMGSFVTSLVIEKLNSFCGRKIAYIIGWVIGVSACIWVQIRSESPQFIENEISVVAILFGIASSIILVTNLGITSDVIGDKTGSGAFVYGIMCFSDKIANGVAVFVIQDLHKNYPTKMYYGNVLTYVCGGAVTLALIAVISLARKERPREDYITLS